MANEHPDYQVRIWCLDAAVIASKKGSHPDKILKSAEKFYGFLFPNKGVVVVIEDRKKDTK